MAVEYLEKQFGGIFDISSLINGFECQVSLEAKIAKFFDSIHSATTFMKYQREQNIDINKSGVLPALRHHPFVESEIAMGRDVADMFFDFHYQALSITDEECLRFGITREIADRILVVVRTFMVTFYNRKLAGTLIIKNSDFPKEATVYNQYLRDENLKR